MTLVILVFRRDLCIEEKKLSDIFYSRAEVIKEYELKQMRNKLDSVLYNEIDFIDMVVKIINEYPTESMTKEQLTKLDLVSNEEINDNNYSSSIKKIKNIILTNNSDLVYFIDDDDYSLNIKIETYKKFNTNAQIKVKRLKDISIRKDIFSF